MQSATFRKWLSDQGCRFDLPEQERGEGFVMVTVHREGRTSQAPLGGSHKVDPRDAHRVCLRGTRPRVVRAAWPEGTSVRCGVKKGPRSDLGAWCVSVLVRGPSERVDEI